MAIKFSFLLASSTDYGVKAASSLMRSGFKCVGALTPTPKKIGRQQILTPNPVDLWLTHLPAGVSASAPIYISDKIIPAIQPQLTAADFLLVVDFGYYIPEWLLKFPRLLAVNLHPSRLPLYRGASPGQMVIKNGDAHSAMSIMTMAKVMDSGALLAQIPYEVDSKWTAQDYYRCAFNLISDGQPSILAQTLIDFAAGKIKPQPQLGTPTFAPKITKADTFIPWDQVQAALTGNATLAQQIERQIRAYSPKPLAWTLVMTTKGKKRLQLLTGTVEGDCLALNLVRPEGDITKTYEAFKDRLIPHSTP
jgi:methionyl-tRNA formyltransferase